MPWSSRPREGNVRPDCKGHSRSMEHGGPDEPADIKCITVLYSISRPFAIRVRQCRELFLFDDINSARCRGIFRGQTRKSLRRHG